ncbi:MAG: Flp family type IVb pilin [Oceanococcus sp.]
MKQAHMVLASAQRGASAIEYALIAGLLAAILVVAISVLGDGFDTTFQNIVDCMTGEPCTFAGSE